MTTFRPPSKSFTIRDYLFIAFIALLFSALAFTLYSFNLKLKGGGDFYTYWAASRVFIFEKVDPYSAEVPARVQALVYDRSIRAGEKPYILDTPFHLVLLYFPFALFSDPLIARALYTLLLELTLMPLALVSLRLTDWKAPILLLIFFAAISVSNFYSIQAIYASSPVLMLSLFYAGILLALQYDLDEVAGALLAVSCYRWEVGAPFLFLVALRAYRQKRAGVLYGFLMLTFVALVVSLLLYANWLIPFLRAVTNNLRADFGYNLRDILRDVFPAYGNLFSWVIVISLFSALTYEWSVARDSDFRRFYWAACLSIASAPLLGFRAEMADLSALLIPLALIFSIVHDRWNRINNFLTALLMAFVFLIPWSLSLISARFAQELIFLFLPVFTVIGLYWIRWWAIRPPRIWTDLAPKP